MAKSIYFDANVISTDSFSGWITKTNEVRFDMATVVVTVSSVAQPNATNGAETTGNAHVEGLFSANTLIASTGLRGGTVSIPAKLSVFSNAEFTSTDGTVDVTSSINLFTVDANNTVVSSNVTFDGGSTKKIVVNVGNTTINTGNFYGKSNTYFTGANTEINGTLFKLTSNSVITSDTLNANVNTITLGFDGTDALNVNSVSDFNANVNIDGVLTTIRSTNTMIGDAGTDVLNVNAISDFNANVNIDGALTTIRSTNTMIGDAGTDVLNVNAVSDFNANVNIDGILTQTANAVFSGALVNIISPNTTIGDAGTDVLNVNATSDFNANVNIDGALTTIRSTNTMIGDAGTDKLNVNAVSSFTANVQIDGALVYMTGANTTIGNAGTDKLNVNATSDFNANVNIDGIFTVTANSTVTGDTVDIDGTTLDITSNTVITATLLTVNAQANVASVMVRDLTPTRIVYAGTGGELVDSSNLTFTGSLLTVTGSANTTGTLQAGGVVTFTDTTESTSTTTGAVKISGGVGIAKNLNVGGTATFNANVDLQDSDYLLIGTGDDLQLYHDGLNSYIKDAGTGALIVDASSFRVMNAANTGTMILATQDAEVSLYHNNTVRVATTSTGANVTGTFGVSGNANVGGTLGVTSVLSALNNFDVAGSSTLSGTLNVTGIATFNANVDLQDNDYLKIGTGDDLQIYHDGTNSYIKDIGAGDLIVDASTFRVKNAANDENMIVATENGAVSLYHDNTLRIATSSTGANVTGTFGVSGSANVQGTFDVAGNSTLAGTLDVTGVTNLNNTTQSTSTSTGTLIVDGGAGIAKDVFIGGNIYGEDTLTLTNMATVGSANVIGTDGLDVAYDAIVRGDLEVYGNTTIQGNFNLIDVEITNLNIVDTLSMNIDSGVDTNFPPVTNNTYDLGSSTKIWRTLYANNVVANVAWSSITSKPDPVVTVNLTGDVTGTGSATLTDLTSGTVSFATTIAENSVDLTTHTTGNYVAAVAAGSGLSLSGTAGEGWTPTLSHSDTSSVANVSINNSDGTVLKDITATFDTFGHVQSLSTGSINLDLRYVSLSGDLSLTNSYSTSGYLQAGRGSGSVAMSVNDGGGDANITFNHRALLPDRTGSSARITSPVDTNIAGLSFQLGNNATSGVSPAMTTIYTANTTRTTIGTDLVVSGNLTVSGTTTIVNSETVNIADNIVVLNSNYTLSAPTENAGIEVERGTLSNISLIWNETTDRWTFTNNGTAYYNIPISTEYDNYSSWTAQDGDGTNVTINSGNYVKFVEGAGSGASIDINFTDTSHGSSGDPYDLTFAVTNTDKGSAQNIFKNIAVGGQSNIVADSNDDTLTLVGSGTVVITTDADTDTVTITGTSIPAANATSEGLVTTGDQTFSGIKTFNSTISGSIDGNAATVTNGVYTSGNQTIAGTKTFSSTISGSISGNAATVTNGVYTSGNQTISGTKTFSSTISGSISGSAGSAATATYANDAGGLRVSSGGAFIIDGIAQTVPVNYLQVRAANTGQDVLMTTAGSDTNIDLLIQTKGTGSITLDTGTSAGVIDLKPGSSNLRIWDNTSTHYHEIITGDPTANRTVTLPNANVTLVSGTMVPTSGTGATGSWGISVTGSSASCTGNAATATKLATARTIGGVSFDGSANIDLPGVNTAGTQNTSGNAATATTLQTTRTINGTNFNGSANITTTNWGTSRTLTIGSTGKSVSGSANVSWSLAEIGAAASSHTHTLSSLTDTTFLEVTSGDILYYTGTTWSNYTADAAGIVAKSGNQTIAGTKTFSSSIVAPGIARTGDITLDASGDIILDAQGNQIYFYDAGVQRGYLGVGTADTITLYTGEGTTNTTFAGANLTCSGDITANSDARLKENVVTVDSALDKVSQMRGVYFNKIGEEKRSLGVIAQEIEEILPEVVLTADDEEGIKSVAYGNIVGVLIEAIKELKAEIEELKRG